MTTPRKEEILKHASEMWKVDRFRRGDPSFSLEPELNELKEEDLLTESRNDLMRDTEKAHIDQYIGYLTDEAQKFGYRLTKGKLDTELETYEGLLFDPVEAMSSGVFISGTSGSGKTNLGFHIAQRLMEQGIIVYVLDPSQAWQKGSSIQKVLTIYAPKGRQEVTWNTREPTVFDLSLLYVKDQRRFCELFCRSTFEHWVRGRNGHQCFVFFEEAQLYLPNGGLRANVFQEVMRLITSGRNFNIRFGLITQFPSMVDKTPVKICKQRYFGWTDEKNDKAYLKAFLGDRVQELETLKVGEFVYDYGNETKRIKVPLFETIRENEEEGGIGYHNR